MQGEKAEKTKTVAVSNGAAKSLETPPAMTDATDQAAEKVTEAEKVMEATPKTPEAVKETAIADNNGPGVTSVASEAANLVTADAKELLDGRYTLIPKGTWPPPIYVDPKATEQERHYIEHRWHAQWEWYDKRASEAKKTHQRVQVYVLIGSTLITALVAFTPPTSVEAALPWLSDVIRVVTVIISIGVGVFTGLENSVFKYGENWRSFRGAAEELLREKALYDVRSGPYRKTKTPFLLFVQRCEEIMTKQNGSFLQLAEEVQQQGAGQPGGQQAGRNAVDDTPSI